MAPDLLASFISSALALLASMFSVDWNSITPTQRAELAELETFLLEHGVSRDLIDYELSRELEAISVHRLAAA